MDSLYDVLVIGAGPAGSQAAVSAAHQMRHVLVLDAGAVSNSRGRAYWSKSVPLQDVPVFPGGVTGPHFDRALKAWLQGFPVAPGKGGAPAGIEVRAGMVLELSREADAYVARASVKPLREGAALAVETFRARTAVIASGFEDAWPDIEVDREARRRLGRYRSVFRYAGNGRGWHVCIRCDGHLHVNGHLAILGRGDYIYDAALGAQDFTDKITILTNGAPPAFSAPVAAQVRERGIDVEERAIAAHIGEGTALMGVRFADGTERFFDGFLVDLGLAPNTAYLAGIPVATDEEGLIRVDEDNQVLGPDGENVPGLFAAGDVVSGARKLVSAAFGAGQNAGLAASDSLRRWQAPRG